MNFCQPAQAFVNMILKKIKFPTILNEVSNHAKLYMVMRKLIFIGFHNMKGGNLGTRHKPSVLKLNKRPTTAPLPSLKCCLTRAKRTARLPGHPHQSPPEIILNNVNKIIKFKFFYFILKYYRDILIGLSSWILIETFDIYWIWS